jgi:hypothetical protein
MEFGNNEIWRAVDGYLNYEISTHGRVRNNKTGRILKPQLGGSINNEYYHVRLFNDFNKKIFKIHRLVCETFNENINNYNCVDHIDRNRFNNFYQNLRWTTLEFNQKNCKIRKDNISGIKGIGFNKKCNKWGARWCEDGKRKSKYFETKDDAINYRKEMEQINGYI